MAFEVFNGVRQLVTGGEGCRVGIVNHYGPLAGTDIRRVQLLLGRANLKPTQVRFRESDTREAHDAGAF